MSLQKTITFVLIKQKILKFVHSHILCKGMPSIVPLAYGQLYVTDWCPV